MEPQVTPAPIAPETAPAPVAPETPAAPAVPETPPVADLVTSKEVLTPEEAAAKAEDDEWAEAAKAQFGDEVETKKEPKKNEPAKPAEDGKTPEADPANPDGKKPDAEQGDDNGAASKAEPKTPDELARDARAAARQTAEQTKAVIADVREKMFKDTPMQWVDSDGDPIHTVQDVMGLRNDATGKAFTEEEAYPFLLAGQQKFNETQAATEAKIISIAETNMAIKQEADYVNAKYGAILKADEALRDKLWAQFEKTLEKDPATGIITKMPVSLEEFYELALEGRSAPAPAAAPPPAAPKPGEPAAPAAPDPAKVAADAAAADAKAKADAETARQQARADRSDIYIPPADAKTVDKEDDEWGKAAKEYYGDRLK